MQKAEKTNSIQRHKSAKEVFDDLVLYLPSRSPPSLWLIHGGRIRNKHSKIYRGHTQRDCPKNVIDAILVRKCRFKLHFRVLVFAVVFTTIPCISHKVTLQIKKSYKIDLEEIYHCESVM